VKKKINNGKKTLLLDGMARNSKCDPHEKSDQSLPAHTYISVAMNLLYATFLISYPDITSQLPYFETACCFNFNINEPFRKKLA